MEGLQQQPASCPRKSFCYRTARCRALWKGIHHIDELKAYTAKRQFAIERSNFTICATSQTVYKAPQLMPFSCSAPTSTSNSYSSISTFLYFEPSKLPTKNFILYRLPSERNHASSSQHARPGESPRGRGTRASVRVLLCDLHDSVQQRACNRVNPL